MQTTIEQTVNPVTVTSPRYLSLDVLRGLTIALMIVVNTPGSWSAIYAPFKHAAWHGFTITDLVFPTFLFVVGNAMSFSMKKFEKQSDSVFLQKVFKRTVLIFLLGFLLICFPFVTRTETGEIVLKNFANIRIMGVLQRIALCYFIASIAIRYLKMRGVIVLSIVFLFSYWGIMYFFADPKDPYSLEGNAALKFDLLLFRPENLYRGFGIPFDPEGLLSTLPAVVNVIAGYLAGVFIQKGGNNLRTISRLIVAGFILIAVAQAWNLVFPINKPIWTSSYVLYTVGLDLLLIGVLMWFIEIMYFRKWTTFFESFGKNPLFIYLLSGLIIKTLSFIRVGETSLQGWIYNNFFLTWTEGKFASLLFALSYMLFLWLIAYALNKRKIYIKV